MARLTADQWETVRAEREAGATFRALAAKYRVSDAAICKRAKAESWGDGKDVGESVRRAAIAKVSGVVSSANPKKKAAAINAAADETAAVVRRHRQEWLQVVALRKEALAAREADEQEAFQRAKLAKITAEMTAIQQAGERKAWNLDAAETAPSQGVIVVNLRRAPGGQV